MVVTVVALVALAVGYTYGWLRGTHRNLPAGVRWE
jgi:hypothetical protein